MLKIMFVTIYYVYILLMNDRFKDTIHEEARGLKSLGIWKEDWLRGSDNKTKVLIH